MSISKRQFDDQADWRDGFLFVANQLALDLVNTNLIMKGEALELISDFSSLVRWFAAAGLFGAEEARQLERKWGNTTQGAQVAAGVRRFRDTLRQELLRWEAGRPLRAQTIEMVNQSLVDFPIRTHLRKTEGAVALETYFSPQRPEDLLAPIADAAARLFAEIPRGRVRKCASCVAHFYDNSKKGNRRWCSMQMCGNREKVAAYAARQRRAPHRSHRTLRAG